MQDVVIATSLAVAIAFVLAYRKWAVRRPSLLLIGAAILGAVSVYESYMHFVWEPSVHAPIRLDIFVIDAPLIVLGVVVGACSLIGRVRPGSPRQSD